MSRSRRSYERVAWCYDELARGWSLGAIPRAREAAVAGLRPGQRALFAGVGCGSDACLAASRGVRVTGVDLSDAMLRRCRARLERAGAEAELVCGDVRDHRPAVPYDAVVASFFFDVFAGDELRGLVHHLAGLLAPGGHLLVSDYAPAPGGAARMLAGLSYWPVALTAALLGLCSLHARGDYAESLAEAGLVLERREAVARSGGVYEWLDARRPGGERVR